MGGAAAKATSAILDNLTVDLSGDDGVAATNFTGMSQFQVLNSTIGASVSGISAGNFGGTASVLIQDNTITGVTSFGVTLVGMLTDGTIEIDGNTIVGAAATAGVGVTTLTPMGAGSLRITGNTVSQVDAGIVLIQVTDSDVRVTGNMIDAASIGILIVDGAGSTFTVGGDITGTATAGVEVINTLGPGTSIAFNGLRVNAAGGVGIRLVTDNLGDLTTSFDGVRLTGGVDGLVVDGPNQSIAGNTLNDTVFVGQTGNYITFLNGALFEPGFPTHIDAGDVSFDGILGRDLTASQVTAVSSKIIDFNDTGDVGLIFFGSDDEPRDLILNVTERASIQTQTYNFRDLKCGAARASFERPVAGPYVFNAINPACPLGEAEDFPEADAFLSSFWRWYWAYHLKN